MLVVADSSPLILLTNIGHLEILPKLFHDILIPPQVAAELAQANRPAAVRAFIAHPPAWLIIRSPLRIEPIPSLQAGETAAISLAEETHADLLLINEIRGRKAAARKNVPITGTIGVLERAADSGLLDLKEAFERVKQTDFWISHELLDERLRLYQQRQ